MSLFGKSKKEKAFETLERLAKGPHRFEVRIGLDSAITHILSIDDEHILLAEFDPHSRNELIEQFPNIRVKTEELVGFTVRMHTFQLELVDQVDWNNSRAYRFTLPKQITTKSQPFTFIPNERDNVTLSFFLHDIQQFKKVEYVSADEIRFQGALAPHRDLFGKVIYNIELKTPFDRVRMSAMFKHLKGSLYSFTEFKTDDKIEAAMERFAKFEFLHSRKLETFIEREGLEDKRVEERSKQKDPKRPKCVLLVDDKRVITEIVGEMLRLKTDYRVITTNDSLETMNLAVEHEPDVILLDLNMPGMDGVTVARKLRENRLTRQIPIIFMTASADSRLVQEAKELGVSSYLKKPVDSARLLKTLQVVITEEKGVSQLMQKRVALLCDDESYAFELLRELRVRDIDVDEFKYADELIRHNQAEHFGLIILRQLGRQSSPLTIINALRRKGVFATTPLVVFPRSASEVNLCQALHDRNLIIADASVEPAAFAANLGSYFS